MKLYSTYLYFIAILTIGLTSCKPPSNKSEVAAKNSKLSGGPKTISSKSKGASDSVGDFYSIDNAVNDISDAIVEQKRLEQEKIDKESLQDLLKRSQTIYNSAGADAIEILQVIKSCEKRYIACSDKNLNFLKDYNEKNKKDGKPIEFTITEDGVMFSNKDGNSSNNFRKFDKNGADITPKTLSNASIKNPARTTVVLTEKFGSGTTGGYLDKNSDGTYTKRINDGTVQTLKYDKTKANDPESRGWEVVSSKDPSGNVTKYAAPDAKGNQKVIYSETTNATTGVTTSDISQDFLDFNDTPSSPAKEKILEGLGLIYKTPPSK